MATNENKTNAEAYRERRKKQIAEAAKKNAKKSPAKEDAARKTVAIIAIVLVACLLLGGIGNLCLNVFCTPQRILNVASVDGAKVSVAEYNYYYSALFNQIYNMSKQYEEYYSSYGSGYGYYATGFDYSKAPDAQTYSGEDEYDELGDSPTWATYFKVNAIRRAILMQKLYDEAVDAGYKLDEAELKEVKDEMDSIRKTANSNDFSLSRYLMLYVGEGVNESTYKKLCERDALAQKYLNGLAEKYGDEFTEEEVMAQYETDSAKYQTIDFRAFAIAYASADSTDEDTDDTAPTITAAEALTKANKMLAAINADASNFTSLSYENATDDEKSDYETDDGNYVRNVSSSDMTNASTTFTDWLFSTSRTAGEKAVIHDSENSTYYVVYMVRPISRDDTTLVNVRHILVKFATTDDDGNTIELTDEIKQTAKTAADEILNTWLENPTEDNFSAIAVEKSEDTGSAEEGGLYENVKRGKMVIPFESWSFDAARQTGDYAIVETTYGYHVMYFVSKTDKTWWENDIRLSLGETKYNDKIDEIYKSIVDTEKVNTGICDYFYARTITNIDKYIFNTTPVETTKAPSTTASAETTLAADTTLAEGDTTAAPDTSTADTTAA